MGWSWSKDEEESLLRMRRDLHQHPELSWHEERTASVVEAALRGLGLQTRRVANLGVIAEIGEVGPTVALRADMDGLPIHEETGLPFSSVIPGVMHACGHDVHTSCLVAVARRLALEPPAWGRVRLIFQPAEEGAGGARALIEEGVLETPRPVAIFGGHIWSLLPTGTVGVVEGPMMGSVDHLTLTIEGKGGHAALPHQTHDPLVAGAYLVTHLQTLVSRRLDPLVPAVLTIGQFHAGTAFNIIPDSATLVGTIRTLDTEAWAALPRLLEEIIHPAVAAFGCKASLRLSRLHPPLINHPAPTQTLVEIAKDAVGTEKIHAFRTLAGEDFSEYLHVIPGCFFFVGAQGRGEGYPHHSPKFCLEESAFPLLVRLLETSARSTLDRLAQGAGLL